MCGILFTNKDIKQYNLNHILQFLKNRGPDCTSIKNIKNYTFIHTLLSMTGPPTEQPFFSENENIICIFNGEIYNFEDFGDYKSDGECLVPLYEEHGINFISKLDGEFAIVLVDFTKNILIFSTDIFGTRPLWMGFSNDDFGLATYKTCLDRCGITNNYQVLANKTYTLDLNTKKIIHEMRVHTFDLNQHKTTFEDWNKAFSQSIYKRTKYAKCGIFIGMSGGYDSGAIACELTKQNIDFSAYSVANVEDQTTMEQRKNIVKKANIIDLNRNDFLKARTFLKNNAEEYYLNFDNDEKDKYNELIKEDNYDKKKANDLLKLIEFRKTGQIVTDDNGAIGCSYICSLAKKQGEKIYLSGSGAEFETLTESQRNAMKKRKVTDVVKNRIVNFDQILLKPTNSFENFYNINKKNIQHVIGNCYKVKIGINHPGLKYCSKSRFTILENNKPLPYPVSNHSLIEKKGNGMYCIWTSNILLFSTIDNSDPRKNDKEYAIIKLNDNLRKMKYENFNSTNGKEYYITIRIKECTINSNDYFKIRDIFNYYNFVPNILVCDNYEIFMDLPNIKFCRFSENNTYDSRVIIDDVNTTIDTIRTKLFQSNNYDNNYTIIKGNNPLVTLNIFSIDNYQFKFALESALRQNSNCKINIIKNELPHNALNAMINRSTTKYTIQMDEDMIFFNENCINKMVKQIESESSDVWQYCYALKDMNFGVKENFGLLGIKIFNIELMKKNNMKYSNENNFAIDRMIQIKAKELKLKNISSVEQIGYHQKNFQSFDLFLRCAKIGLELVHAKNLNNISKYGNYEIGTFIRYITMFEYNNLMQTIFYIINNIFKKNPNVFFDKSNEMVIGSNFVNNKNFRKEFHIDENKFNLFLNISNIPTIGNYFKNKPNIDNTFMFEKDTKFFCLLGFLYPFYFEFEYDVIKYPTDWFSKIF